MDDIGSSTEKSEAKIIIRRREGEETILISPGKLDVSGIKPGPATVDGVNAQEFASNIVAKEYGRSALNEVIETQSTIYKPPNQSGLPRLNQRNGRTKKGVHFTKERTKMENLLNLLVQEPGNVKKNIGIGVVTWPELSQQFGYPLAATRKEMTDAFNDLSKGVRKFNSGNAYRPINNTIERLSEYKIFSFDKDNKLMIDLEKRSEIPIQELIQVAIGAKKPKISVKAHTKEESKEKKISVSRRSVQQESLPSDDKQKNFKTLLSEILAFYRDAAIRSLHAIASYLLMIK
jgi:hypothetical protein